MAAKIGTDVATHVSNTLADKVMKEAEYLCCYKSYVEYFEEKKSSLSATVKSVSQDITEAENKNENQIDPKVQHWLEEAEGLIQQDTRAKKKWLFGLCTNCFWQYRRGKELERKTQRIKELIDTSNFSRTARSTGLPGIEYHSSSQNFIHFESRKLKFEQLMEALKDENMHVIGMKGMGGTGKTTIAIELGEQVKNSKLFDKVILSIVSRDAKLQNIRGDIAKHLGLEFNKEMDESEQLWKRIAEVGEKVLIILDDVWERLNLQAIGIKPGRHDKGSCSILLTTRNMEVCGGMNCQKTIELEDLSEEDALNLFLFHAGASGNYCSDDSKVVALDIVKECGRLPVAIVAVANTLKNWPPQDWQAALTQMKNTLTRDIVDEYETKVYNSLRFSYDHLNNKNAQDFLLLCSLFPEDHEIPIELLSRIAIGLGLCGEVDKYYIARSQVPAIKNKLINSSLLLKAEKESVKMHDLVCEMALQRIGNKEIQVILDSNTSLKENMRYSYWNIDDFPKCPDGGSKLEALLLWKNATSSKKDPVAFFEGMTSLRVLILVYKRWPSISTPSLVQSIQSLTNLRTLIIREWNLGDISIVKNLLSLEALELTNCSINELPNEINELKRLRLLDLRNCVIDRNNPFEVIERCQWLEELYYVKNIDVLYREYDGELQERTLPKLRRYNIEGHYYYSLKVDPSLSRCFSPLYLKNVFSKATFKFLVVGAEALELGHFYETGWTNLIPDIVPMEDEGIKDLSMLSLRSWSEIKCLVCTDNLRSDLTIFTKVVELRLFEMDVKELCCGPFPIDFLKKLKILQLTKCLKLEGTLFRGKLELGCLKSIKLEDCSITYLFHPSIAESLKQLETLHIRRCRKLKCIISYERSRLEKVDHHDPNQRSQGLMFPELRFLYVEGCDKLEFILPICFVKNLPLLESVKIDTCENLKYIFGQYPEEGDLYQMGKKIILSSLTKMEILGAPNFVDIYTECYLLQSSPTTSDVLKVKNKSCMNNFSWGRPLCCFQPKSSRDNPSDSKRTQLDPTASQELKTMHVRYAPQHFYPHNLREMIIKGFSNLTSLFTVSIASSMLLLERFEVRDCTGLKHIVTDDGDGHHMNCDSIFPNLREVRVSNCNLLESLFPASHFRTFEHLEVLIISNAHELIYVFGNCYGKDNLASPNSNVKIDHLDLPALKTLLLEDVPNMVGICTENYNLTALSLETTWLVKCPQLTIRPCTEREDLTRRKALEMGLDIDTPLCLLRLWLNPGNMREMRIRDCSNLTSLFTLSIASSMLLLETLEVRNCNGLKHIVTNDDGGGDDHLNCDSIFPNLREAVVSNCDLLASLFPASHCRSFGHLERLYICHAHELRYVFGQCYCEDNLAFQISNVEIHLDLPVLKRLDLMDVPNMMGICAKNYYLTASSLETTWLRECPHLNIRPFMKQEDLKRRKALKTRLDFHTPLCLLRLWLNPRNMREMTMRDCSNLTSLFTLSIASSMLLLETLEVGHCNGLKHIVTDNDGGGHPNLNCNSIFPNLRQIVVSNCDLLESLFPASHCRSFGHLERLHVYNAHELIYVFGQCYCEDNLAFQNSIVDIHLDFPVLRYLTLEDIPNMIDICAQNYYLMPLSPQTFRFKGCPALPISLLTDCPIGRQQRQENLSVRKAIGMRLQNLKVLDVENLLEIDTIYDLEGLQIERPMTSSLEWVSLKNLVELRHIGVGPKNGLSLQILSHLEITECKKLKVVFSASIWRSLPWLRELTVSDCEELEHITEENEQNPNHLHELCFPNLREIQVDKCKSIKFLFSISTCGVLPELYYLRIRDAPELAQVFGCMQGDTQIFSISKIFPRLSKVELINLQSLHSICQGIDFQTVKSLVVHSCPNISLTSTEPMSFEDEGERTGRHQTKIATPNLTESKNEAPKEISERDLAMQDQNKTSPNLTESIKGAANEIVEQLLISDIPMISTPSSNTDMVKEIEEASVQERLKLGKAIVNQFKDSELSKKPAPFDKFVGQEAKNERIIMDQLAVAEKGPDMHFNESKNNIKASVGEGPPSEKYDIATSSTHPGPEISHQGPSASLEKETMGDIQKRLGESMSSNEAARRGDKPLDDAQKVKEPSNVFSSDESSNKTELAIALTIDQMKDSAFNLPVASLEDTSPLVSLLSADKKPQAVTTTSRSEPRCSQPNSSDISSNMPSPQDQVIVKIEDNHINPQQIEEDLIRLLQIMEGANMEVRLPYISDISTLEDDSKMAKAFADLEASLKMDLNEIASSEEHCLRLENALNFLSTQCSEDGPLSHGLRARIDSSQLEIHSIISSFKLAYATTGTFAKLEEKEKYIIEEGSQRKEAAKTLLSEIQNTQQKEAELKEQISRLRAQLHSKEREIRECEIKLSSLQERKKKSVSDTMGFIMESEAVKKQRQELENVDVKWTSCVANLRKTALLLGVHLK